MGFFFVGLRGVGSVFFCGGYMGCRAVVWVIATWPLMQRAFRTAAAARVTFSLLAQRESNQREMA
jgi:hypothetical protein